MTSDPIFWLLAITGVIITGISKSGFAGGAGVVAVPLLSFKIGVLEATAITLPLLLAMDAQTLRYYFRQINWPELRGLIPGALVGIFLGGFAMGSASDSALMLGLGILCILFALWARLQQALMRFKGARFFWSTSSGLSSTLVHAGGPPINIYFVSRALPKAAWLATAGAFFAIMNAIKLIPYSLNGQWSLQLVAISVVLLPMAYLGVWLGKQIQGRLSETQFMQACRFLLFAVGVSLIWKVV
ncbi:hypothetical protein A3742_04845 [Oleiphilus sp. HI0071]|uniref:sulfite exporter TauE/SafE family protein n=1 Tax=unclassified Oleiphilus TaxID=2631174 RepID=UPI0007C2273D|nr:MULTISPECIES: sulfite exporter TauE/SafE family protein [unclassified Oleiphilus]KZY63716.1 hypothetical protein A3737_03245 [Oleiphilus sp. HI0065]KZY86508.1 hypothetical protein A3742_04845 [Oleiphilus sp. HI0071]KZZ06064.1 hypothetical protein A3744_07240 [Oleiphilus sp. HI0073]KZZ41753.1 hypothetical protein A3758_22350 [Oleiphilus sp. HI0118]KZZ51378.1 hypothetical protein A3760_12705 [Oleiphilus sp. HI0122]KZZ76334.1 hypothetical protein A3765_09995 [Oleiphilus sp. HI0130]KZZ76810.1